MYSMACVYSILLIFLCIPWLVYILNFVFYVQHGLCLFCTACFLSLVYSVVYISMSYMACVYSIVCVLCLAWVVYILQFVFYIQHGLRIFYSMCSKYSMACVYSNVCILCLALVMYTLQYFFIFSMGCVYILQYISYVQQGLCTFYSMFSIFSMGCVCSRVCVLCLVWVVYILYYFF